MGRKDVWLLTAVLATAVPAWAGSAIGWQEAKTPDGKPVVTIENELYRLTFAPHQGGRCTSFYIKKSKREWVYDGKTGGLFHDHFAHQYWPGELMEAPYKYEITGDKKKAVTVHLWTVAKGGRDGRDPLVKGLKVEKRVTLEAGRREVKVINTFTNPTAEGKNVAMWVQHCFCYGGQRLFDSYYRPSASGLSLDGMDDTGEHKIVQVADAYGLDWVRDPVAGWTAGRDRRTNEGAVFLLDYNYLNIIYNCANGYTTEWFLDKVPLPSGKSWSTEHWIVPIDGFRAFAHASRRLVANVEVTPAKDRVTIRYQLAGMTDPVGTVVLKTRVYGVRSKREATLKPVTVPNVGLTPVGATQTWPHAQTEPLVFRVEASGKGWRERFEYIHNGAFASEGIQGAAAMAEYTIPRPKKVKTFLKPDRWTRPNNKHPRVLLVYGLWTQHYRVEEAVKALDPKADIKVCEGWDNFPPTYDELLRYDLVVLSNMPAGPDYANEMVADFARHGGGLLVLGGMKTYGAGGWCDTALAEVVPVTIGTPYDLQRAKANVAPGAVGNHPTTRDVVWPTSARFFWVHQTPPKPGATVALQAGTQPILVVTRCAEGRVAAVLGTCHGEPAPGQTEAWTTRAWTQLVTQTLRWLKEGK